MRSFLAFFKKEMLEAHRGGKLLLLALLFLVFGIMNPAIAKLTPWLVDMLSEELAESGMVITEVAVDALTSWTQFFKNIPMALIAFVLILGGIFTREYESGTLILVLTKGLARSKILLAKYALLFTTWTAGYWLCFLVTYAYNAYFWDNAVAVGLMPAVLHWWLFGVLVITLMTLFSVLSKSYSGVLLGTGAVVLASYVLAFLPKASKFMPTSLMNSAALLVGAEKAGDYLWTVVIAAVASILCVGISIPIFHIKQL
jgi:ABC-2 type transport system permease protein